MSEKEKHVQEKRRVEVIDRRKTPGENLRAREEIFLKEWLPKVGKGYDYVINKDDNTFSLTRNGKKLDIHIKKVSGVLQVAELMEIFRIEYVNSGMSFIIESEELYSVKKGIQGEKIRLFDSETFAKMRHYDYIPYHEVDFRQVNRLNSYSLKTFCKFMNEIR